MKTQTKGNALLARLRHHVTGAIERGEATAIAGIPAPPATVYESILAAGIAHASHESDLYLPDTAEVRAILERFPLQKKNATRFQNQVEGGTWIDVPFSYLPFWEAKLKHCNASA